jgi:hypothetical protein
MVRDGTRVYTAMSTAGTASMYSNHETGTVDCNSRRTGGPTKTIRGLFLTQLNRLGRLAVI